MKLLVQVRERRPRKGAAGDALHRVRLQAICAQHDLIAQGLIRWAFYSHGCQQHHLLMECESLEEADGHLKASPLFPFCTAEVIPVVTSDAVVSEIRGALGLTGAVPSESLVSPARAVNPAGSYWLVRKELPPMDPLSTAEQQADMLLRTVESKTQVNAEVEFADLNAVGQMVGYLIGEGTRDQVHAYMRSCALFDELVCSIDKLLTPDQAQAMTEDALSRRAALPMSPAPHWPCGLLVYSKA